LRLFTFIKRKTPVSQANCFTGVRITST
jgi:hypothetical protein